VFQHLNCHRRSKAIEIEKIFRIYFFHDHSFIYEERFKEKTSSSLTQEIHAFCEEFLMLKQLWLIFYSFKIENLRRQLYSFSFSQIQKDS